MKNRCTLHFKAFLICVIASFTLFNCQKERNNAVLLRDSRVVPEYLARQVAEKFDGEQFFVSNRDSLIQQQVIESRLTEILRTREIKNGYTLYDKNKKPAIYLFNYTQGGFVFVSAEYTLQPILAYVPSGEAKRDTVPAGFIMWIQKTIENIEIVRDGLYDNSRIGIAAWRNYLEINNIDTSIEVEEVLSDFSQAKILRKDQANNAPIEPEPDCDTWYTSQKGPFIPVTWGQGKSYNELINPNVNYGCFKTGNDRPWTGCVATAMAQLIRYWKSTPTYDYNSMPNNQGNAEVQKLMFHAGVFVDMTWGCETSGALTFKVDNALETYFGFNSGDRIWNNQNIYNKTYDNLNKGWPVLLGGCATAKDFLNLGLFNIVGDCHLWICDGYQSAYSACGVGYTYYHMNWGWHETWANTDYNGWFGFYNWDITYANGTHENFQYANDAIVDIHP